MNLEGRHVLYTYMDGDVRPAFIVKDWGAPSEDLQYRTVNLQVLTDDQNDGRPAVDWVTSVMYDEHGQAGSWRFLD